MEPFVLSQREGDRAGKRPWVLRCHTNSLEYLFFVFCSFVNKDWVLCGVEVRWNFGGLGPGSPQIVVVVVVVMMVVYEIVGEAIVVAWLESGAWLSLKCR